MPSSDAQPPTRLPQCQAAPTEPSHSRRALLSNHAHVLIWLARDSSGRLRDVAEGLGITERAVGRIVNDLEAGGFLARRREGRRNSYRLDLDHPMRHAVGQHRQVRDLIELFVDR